MSPLGPVSRCCQPTARVLPAAGTVVGIAIGAHFPIGSIGVRRSRWSLAVFDRRDTRFVLVQHPGMMGNVKLDGGHLSGDAISDFLKLLFEPLCDYVCGKPSQVSLCSKPSQTAFRGESTQVALIGFRSIQRIETVIHVALQFGNGHGSTQARNHSIVELPEMRQLTFA